MQRYPSQQDETTDDNISKMDTSERESTASWLWSKIFASKSQPRLFQLWVRAFHWNFAQYLPAYLQWRAYVDITVVPTDYKDEALGHFEVQHMVSWQM